MTKEDLQKLKEKLSKLSLEEQKQRDLYIRKLSTGEIQGPPVGYPSIDKPWLAKYPEMLFHFPKENSTVFEKLQKVWNQEDESIINYYDTEITVRDFCNKVYQIAGALQYYGMTPNDSIVSSLESVPEYIELLLACELIGCSIKNYIGDAEDIIHVVKEDTEHLTKLYIAPDYILEEVAENIYQNTDIEHIITVNPLFSVKDKSTVAEHITQAISSRYTGKVSTSSKNISFDEFLQNGKTFTKYEGEEERVLFTAYTSGSTGRPKGVNHSAKSMLGIINQMALVPSHEKERDSWLLTILPPTLVAVIVAMTFYPLLDGKKLILDPYCRIEDIDLEMMHYEPNCWPLIPIFFEVLVSSKRIPNDYDMSYFKLFGFGAEPITRKFASRVQEFLQIHNCKAPISSGYGQSEGGSDFTIAMGNEMISSGCAGLPLIDTVISIFDSNSKEKDLELGYYQVGEVCKKGPGIMLGYSNATLTEEVLKVHSDGNTWLHTGDFGFMTPDGLLFVLGRGGIKVYGQDRVFPLNIENKVSDIDGVKEAIVVSGVDRDHEGYELPYLFVIPEKNIRKEDLLERLEKMMHEELKEGEIPQEVYLIDKKPIYKFKTNRKLLQKTYHLV